MTLGQSRGHDTTVRGANEEAVLRKAAEHAKEHGLQPSPELLAKVKSHIENE
jgi:predicted small metal-binding protein